MRCSREPRRTPVGEESGAASFSRLWMARYRVIVNDDTLRRESSQYIFEKQMFLQLDATGTDRRSLGRTATLDPANSHTPRL